MQYVAVLMSHDDVIVSQVAIPQYQERLLMKLYPIVYPGTWKEGDPPPIEPACEHEVEWRLDLIETELQQIAQQRPDLLIYRQKV